MALQRRDSTTLMFHTRRQISISRQPHLMRQFCARPANRVSMRILRSNRFASIRLHLGGQLRADKHHADVHNLQQNQRSCVQLW